MKNSKIHSGLENSHLRDFLSISMVKSYAQEVENTKRLVPYRSNEKNAFEWAIDDCKNEIEFHNKRLELLKEKQAILTLIKMQGWEEFDVSDETEKDLEYTLKMNFVGTPAEHEELIKRIKEGE